MFIFRKKYHASVEHSSKKAIRVREAREWCTIETETDQTISKMV